MRIDCDFDPLPQPALVPQNTELSSFEKNAVPVVLWGSDAHSGRMYYICTYHRHAHDPSAHVLVLTSC